MPGSGPRIQKHARLPGRQEDSSLADLLRRRFNGIFFPCFFTAPLPILALMCVFERGVDTVLGMFGYSNEFVSSFPFIRALYLNVTSAAAPGRIDIGYFHILDAALWVSIIAWTIWLIVGVVLLKAYDLPLRRVFSAVLLSRFRGSRLLMNLTIALPLPFFLLGVHVFAQPKFTASPEIFLVLKYLPGAFFFLLATACYYGVVFSSVSLLYFVWKLFCLFRQNRPRFLTDLTALHWAERHRRRDTSKQQ